MGGRARSGKAGVAILSCAWLFEYELFRTAVTSWAWKSYHGYVVAYLSLRTEYLVLLFYALNFWSTVRLLLLQQLQLLQQSSSTSSTCVLLFLACVRGDRTEVPDRPHPPAACSQQRLRLRCFSSLHRCREQRSKDSAWAAVFHHKRRRYITFPCPISRQLE